MLRDSAARDVVDFLEYDIDPDVWIGRLIRQIESGSYEPRTPQRFSLAKSRGFSRTMTSPHIPDLTLYRAIADYLFGRMKRYQHKHVYFDRADLSAQRAAKMESSKTDKMQEVEYSPLGRSRFPAWLHFNQYREQLILERVYPFIVTTAAPRIASNSC